MRSFLLLILGMFPLVVKSNNFNSAMIYKNGVVSKLPSVLCDGPADIAIQGNFAYICNKLKPAVTVVDLNSNSVVKNIQNSVIQEPYNIAVNGDYAYVTDVKSGLYCINLVSGSVIDYTSILTDYSFNKLRPLVFDNNLFVSGADQINYENFFIKINIGDPSNPNITSALPMFNDGSFVALLSVTSAISGNGSLLYLGGQGSLNSDPSTFYPCVSVIDTASFSYTKCIYSQTVNTFATMGALVYVSDTKLYGCSNYQNDVLYPDFGTNPIVFIDLINDSIKEISQVKNNFSAVLKNNRTRTFQNKFNSLSSLGQDSLYLNTGAFPFSQPAFYSGYSMVHDKAKKVVYVANLGPCYVRYGDSPLCEGKESKYLSWNKQSFGGGGQGNNVLVIDTNTNQIIGNIKGFNSPQAMALRSDGSLYVCDGSEGALFCGTFPLKGQIKKVQ